MCEGHRCLKVLCLPLKEQVFKSPGVQQNSCVGEFVVTLCILKQVLSGTGWLNTP